MDSLSVEKTEFIESVMKNFKFNNIHIQIDGQTEKGDGYVGVVQFVKITEEDGFNEIDLVVKSAKQNENFRKQSPIRKIFLREIYMYETVHPEFASFQIKKGILKPFTGIPKMYGCLQTDLHETLLLENMKKSGYTLWNRKVPMDSEHVSLVFKEYGKFHAISLAMRHLEPELYEKLTADMENVFEDKSSKAAERFQAVTDGMFKKAFGAVNGCNNSVVRSGLEKFSKEAFDFFMVDFENTDYHLVVQHADCWCNNMMFKYEENTTNPLAKPSKVCLLDWQISRVGSPVLDLAYFFFVCSHLDVIYDSKQYLKVYHDTVTENLRNFGCNPEEIFPYDLLEKHWKKFAKYGFLMALMITNVLLRDSEEVPDLAEAADRGVDIVEAVCSASKNVAVEEAYNKRILDLATYMAENELF